MKLFLKKSIVTSPFILDTIGFSKKAGEFMLEFTPDVRKIDGLQSGVRPKTRFARTLALQNPVQSFDLHAEGQSSSIAVFRFPKIFLQILFTLYAVLLFNFSISICLGQDTDPPTGTPTSFLTELFDDNDFDLQFTTLTFTPDNSTGLYTICREAASSFPVDPTDHSPLLLELDDFTELAIADGATFPFFGTSYSSFFVGSNGYITFTKEDTEFEESLEAHFSAPRIAAYFDDLDPPSDGSISWKQLNDRVVVTFEEISEFFDEVEGIVNSNSFQIELFFDGRIQITWLGMDAVDGLVGLSEGEDIPAEFVESDLSASGRCIDEPGKIVFEKTVYSCGQLLDVEIRDLNAPAEPLSITLATTSGDSETIVVEDVDGDKFYRRSLPISSQDDPIIPDDNLLQGISGDTITVTYNDTDTGEGTPFVVTKTATLDCQAPVISVDPQELSISAGVPAPDLTDGVSATDDLDGDLTARVVVDGNTVDTASLGTYTVTYDVVDSAGNAAVQQSRTYHVNDNIPPLITYYREIPVIKIVNCC